MILWKSFRCFLVVSASHGRSAPFAMMFSVLVCVMLRLCSDCWLLISVVQCALLYQSLQMKRRLGNLVLDMCRFSSRASDVIVRVLLLVDLIVWL